MPVPPTRAAGTVRVLPGAPVPGRSWSGAVWTGREMVVWGGVTEREETDGKKVRTVVEERADGAAYDPATDRWRVLPVAPLSGRERPVMVWTGERVLVVGGRVRRRTDGVRDGAAYDPVADSWEVLPGAPEPPSEHVVWTGEEAVFVSELGGVAYHPGRRTWRTLAGGPGLEWVEQLVWTGSEVIVLGSDGGEELAGAAYDPGADRWRELPEPGVSSSSGRVAVWSSGKVLVVSPSSERVDGGEVDPFPKPLDPGGVYDPATDRWSALPLAPAGLGATYRGALTPRGVLFWDGGPTVARFDPATARWSSQPVPGRPGRSFGVLIWTGAELVVWGGDGCPPLADCVRLVPPPEAIALTP
ncbi:hypothetical protein EDD29_2939 [Actinocorallia herbida]|uniref:Galactose oxidase-like protein n=1 Tax=Actinocorallia herbida TaxID=58109 RepID=A0A3N1CVV1_9ACTN|nr:hypothetical protein [Actinocorallia herbida]ROO85396.1 hypothetical protein EDD29_2939 [Actinocorallia herbida]